VLEQFVRNGRYNLIFAPHVMLFQRQWVFTVDKFSVARVRPPSPRYHHAPNMLIDLGSQSSVDMTYTRAADIYVGDVSSQVYEFLVDPRPCLFLDAHQTDWRDNPDYTHWKAGPVSTRAEDIIAQLDAAVASHAEYLPMQQAMLADTFDITDVPSSQRAASAILAVINN
jgi:CDP-glycerol glycerophosphotransferase (TagB/SpsB family)